MSEGEEPDSPGEGPADPKAETAAKWRIPLLVGLCALALGAAILITSWVRDDSPEQTAAVSTDQTDAGLRSSTTRDGAGGSSRPGSTPTTSKSSRPTEPKTSSSQGSGASSFTMLFAGDILPHGPVNRMAEQLGGTSGQAHDYAPLFGPLKPIVSSADLAICHMEVPLAPTDAQISSYPMFGAPVGLIKGISETGYDGCSTASNHSLDKGKAGIAATISAFDFANLGHTGTYTSAKDAKRIQTYDVKGVKVAHLSYAYGFNGIPLPADAPYAANLIDQERILSEAKRARAAGAQFVVVSLHWGNEYQQMPSAQQLALAPALTASPDVDLIIGHHAHVVQPIVKDNGKFVVFGLGNQLSNQTQDPRRDGLTVLVTVTRGKNGRYAASLVRAIPTFVDLPSLRVYPVAPMLADPSTPSGLRSQLEASFARTMGAINSLRAAPGVVAYDPARP